MLTLLIIAQVIPRNADACVYLCVCVCVCVCVCTYVIFRNVDSNTTTIQSGIKAATKSAKPL